MTWHRNIVGGGWETMGRLQFDFLLKQGLNPESVLLDVGCGSFRGGVHFVNFLNEGRYLAMDADPLVVQKGILHELGKSVYKSKRPEIVISRTFEFDAFSKSPDFALAQSVFSHLFADEVQLCLKNLRRKIKDSGRFYATYNECAQPKPGQTERIMVYYTRDEMISLGQKAGWNARCLGDWGHPRGQLMMEFVAD